MKKVKDVKFWCAVGITKQMAFKEDGTMYTVDKEAPVGDQHILYNSVLMCGKSRDGIKKYRRTKNKGQKVSHKIVQLRIENVPLCKECQRKYKENSNLAWTKWALSSSQKPPIMGLQDAFKEVVSEQLHGVTGEKSLERVCLSTRMNRR